MHYLVFEYIYLPTHLFSDRLVQLNYKFVECPSFVTSFLSGVLSDLTATGIEIGFMVSHLLVKYTGFSWPGALITRCGKVFNELLTLLNITVTQTLICESKQIFRGKMDVY